MLFRSIKNRVKDTDTPETIKGVANAALNKIIDNVEAKLKSLGVSTERDAQGNIELENIIYRQIIPAARQQAFTEQGAPVVTKGKRGRKPSTPEQQAEAKAKQNQMAGASRDASRAADRASEVLSKEFDAGIYATDAEALDAANQLLADQREAIDTLYDIANNPAHRNNKAGKTAKAALAEVPQEEMALAKERAELRKKTAQSVLRSAKQSQLADSTNGTDNNR